MANILASHESGFNPKFRKAYAIAKQIPKRKNKKAAIRAWCKAALEGLK